MKKIMATEMIDKDYITIKVSKKIGRMGIQRIKDFINFLETNKDASRKVPQKTINELSRKINKAAWDKLKKKREITL
ncbi:MAG: hypothetical protein ABI707_04330 [Ferruginibacter sp.]